MAAKTIIGDYLDVSRRKWPSYVAWNVAEEEIGVSSKHLHDLLGWLYGDDDSPSLYRYACSPVTRSEAELLGISGPRFAVRAILGNKGFVNLRRNESLAQSLSRQGYHWAVEAFRTKGRAIADSLLSPPSRVDGFHILTADLGGAYDEPPVLNCVPFLNHVRIGGGMCAQATCSMASYLLHKHATWINGVAEISALAAREKRSDRIEFGGLNVADITDYLRSIGLNASEQVAPVGNLTFDDWFERRGAETAAAIDSYLQSGMPVMYVCDLGCLLGSKGRGIPFEESIAAKNSFPNRYSVKDEPQPHVVLIVGSDCRENGNQTFVLNDPATFPFVTASIESLFRMRRYRELRQDDFITIPVTPGPVKCSLLSSRHYRDRSDVSFETGLLEISSMVAAGLVPVLPPHVAKVGSEAMAPRHSQFRLVKRSDLSKLEGLLSESELRATKQVLLTASSPDWVWLELKKPIAGATRSVWVWNAELDATSDCNADLLVALLCDDGRQISYINDKYPRQHEGRVENEDENGNEALSKLKLSPSLITSFVTSRHSLSRLFWPNVDDRPVGCELYVWMLPNYEKRMLSLGVNRSVCCLQMLSEVWCKYRDSQPGIIGDLAAQVSRDFAKAEIPVIALASFLPEITAQDDNCRLKAQEAVSFLVEFALALQREGQPTHTIELVGGSRYGGIQRVGTDGDSARYSVPFMGDELAECTLLNSLEVALENTNITDDHKLSLALELEPGPLYVLRNQSSLESFLSRLEGRPRLEKRVGFNLDVAHWRMAKIQPDEIRHCDVFRSIVHSHISGHHTAGHLGDTIIGEELLRELHPWLSLISDAYEATTEGGKHVSGHISVEYEAAGDYLRVHESVHELEMFLDKHSAE